MAKPSGLSSGADVQLRFIAPIPHSPPFNSLLREVLYYLASAQRCVLSPFPMMVGLPNGVGGIQKRRAGVTNRPVPSGQLRESSEETNY